MRKPDYGGATHEEIMAGLKVAMSISDSIRAIPNPAVQNMVKELVALIRIMVPPK